MVSQELAESPKLGLARVPLAELEGLERRGLVHDLQPSIVLQNFQDRAIRFPKELQPWGDDGPIGSIPGLLTRDCGKQYRLWCLNRFQVFDISPLGAWLERGLNDIRLCLGFCNFLLRKFDELLENKLDTIEALGQ